MTDLRVDLRELRRLLDAATPGPWGRGYWSGQCHKHEPGQHPGPSKCVYDYELVHGPHFDSPHRLVSLIAENQEVAGNYDYEEGGIIHEADANLIVAAVNALPALLDELDRRGDSLNNALIERDDACDALAAALTKPEATR